MSGDTGDALDFAAMCRAKNNPEQSQFRSLSIVAKRRMRQDATRKALARMRQARTVRGNPQGMPQVVDPSHTINSAILFAQHEE